MLPLFLFPSNENAHVVDSTPVIRNYLFFLAETEVLAYIPSRFLNGKIPSEGD
jgi:hypothetical protein